MSDSKNAKKKEEERRSGLGETAAASAVSSLLGDIEKQEREAVTHGRGLAGHGGKLGQDKRGHQKATYNIPIEIQTMVRSIAEAEDVGQADIVHAAIVALHNAYQAGKVDFHAMREPARSIRVLWKLSVPEDFGTFS